MYRSSTSDITYADDLPPVRGERWDRDRFERMRGGRGGGGGGGGEHDHYRFTEHDRFPGGRRDVDIHEDFDRPRRGPPVMERERFREDERFDAPYRRPRPELFEEPTPAEVANRALAPYRRQSVVEKDIDISVRRPARPQYIRRQSSLDTFDRRPVRRYDDYDRQDDYRIPPNVPIPLPIRQRQERRFDDYEDVRYREFDREREPRGRESEEFREVEVRREKSRRRRSRSRAAKSIAATSVRSSSTSSFEEIAPARASVGRKGKTRLPKRLCKTQAVEQLGYPYEEEDDFIVVKRALEKDHIDEIIKVSESYKEEKTTYVYEDKKAESVVSALPPPPPPPPASIYAAPPPPPPPPASIYAAPPPPPTVVYPQSVRSASPPRHEHFEERIEESNHIGGPLTVLVPGREDHRYTDERRITRVERDVRSERDIKDEIRQLEAERRMLRYEREGDYEVIERREPRRDVVRLEKDRKVRRKEPNPKLVAAMMSTLS